MSLSKRFYTNLGISLWLLAVVFVILPVWPNVYYRLSPNTSSDLATTIAYTVTEKPSTTIDSSKNTPLSDQLPSVDPSLPVENGLIIDSIGVRGEIHEGDDWQEILKLGIWRVPNFATPLDSPDHNPIILAAHRWGYLSWSNSFRKLNSFYNLPTVKKDDLIRINWQQRQFVYKVYSTETNTEISDYSADLILYTCQLWNSPTRFFVYAQKID